MNQIRKYLGMTAMQIGILAGLAGAACLLFGLAGFFVFRRSFFSQAPENMPTVQSTPTIILLPSLTPTVVPTPVPYEELIPSGWTQHLSALVEIWLPPSFKDAGSNAGSLISGNSVVLEMALTASASGSSVYKTFATVSYEPLNGDSLDSFLDARLSNIPAEINMAERRKVFINNVEAHRLMFEGHSNNVDMNDLLYVFRDGSTVWYVKYSAQINDFYEMLSTFEQSVKTFRIVR